MATISEWLLSKCLREFSSSFNEENLKSDCEELLCLKGQCSNDVSADEKEEIWKLMQRWQFDKEYLGSLGLHIIVAKHIRASCKKRQRPDYLESWKNSDVRFDAIDAASLASEIEQHVRIRLDVRIPHDPLQDTKMHEPIDLRPVEDFHNGLEQLIGYPSVNVDFVEAMKLEHEQGQAFTDSRNRKIIPAVEWNVVVRTEERSIMASYNLEYKPIDKRVIEMDYEYYVSQAKDHYGEAGLNEAEVIALRLWTGPMHEKYAQNLREQVTIYTNTLYAINSGITKLAQKWKIPSSRKVYRGYKKRIDLHKLLKKDDCKGGVEPSFLATTENFDVAAGYASEGAFILEISVGQVNKGADIGWLSQFPHEKEILFNALSNVEFIGNPQMQFVEGSGRIQVYKVQISSNTKSKTLEQYVRLRKDLHLNMAEVLVNQALRLIEHRKQSVKDELVKHLCLECESRSNEIVRKGEFTHYAVFNEGRDEYIDLVREVILFQRQSLCIIDLTARLFDKKEACPIDLMNLAEWQLQALRSSFRSFETPKLEKLIFGDFSMPLSNSIFHAERCDLGEFSTQDAAISTGRLVSLNPKLRYFIMKVKNATVASWDKLFKDFAGHSDIRINGLMLSRYAIASLQRLELKYQPVQEISMVVGALVHHPPNALTDLSMRNCQIGCDGAETLGHVFSSLQNLVSLRISACKISDKGCTGIGKSLSKLSALRCLNLSRNDIGSPGASSLAPALGAMTDLKVVDLSHNLVGSEGIFALNAGTRERTGMFELDLRFNKDDVCPSQLGSNCKIKNNVLIQLHCREKMTSLGWSSKGSRIASGSCDGTVIMIWDAETGEQKSQLKGHSRGVTSLAWNPEGSKIVSAGSSTRHSLDNWGEIILWDAATKKRIFSLKGHSKAVNSVTWSPEGSKFASGSADNTIIIWDAVTGEQKIQLKGHSDSVQSVAWSPDGLKIASASVDSSIFVWDAEAGEQKAQLRGHTDWVNSVVWSPKGFRIASGSRDNSVIIWDAETGEQKGHLKGHTYWISSVVWSPEGSKIVSGSRDKTILIWDAETGEQQFQLKGHTEGVLCVVWNAEGSKIASTSWDKTIILWDAETGPGEDKTQLKGHTDTVNSVAWSPLGSAIASGSCDKTIIIWDAETGEQKAQLKNHTGEVLSVAWSPEGSMFASSSYDKTIIIWDAETGEQKAQLKGHTTWVRSVAWSPDCSKIVSAAGDIFGGDPEIIVWDVVNENKLMELQGNTGSLNSVASSSKGSKEGSNIDSDEGSEIDSNEGSKLEIDSDEGSKIESSEGSKIDFDGGSKMGHTNAVTSVSWSPEGSKIVSGGGEDDEEGEIIIWDAKTGAQTCHLKGHTDTVRSVAWSPEGSKIVSGADHRYGGGDPQVIIWDAVSGNKLSVLKGHTDGIGSVAWSPEGSTIASGSRDKTVIIWNAETGEQKTQLAGHTKSVNSVVWSCDGCKIASGSSDNMVIIWNAETGGKILSSKAKSIGSDQRLGA